MSQIKLYSSTNSSTYAWKLIPSKLFKIDNIADYLALFTPTTINKFQYIKNALELSIKIDATQIKAQPNATTGYKYLSIQNTDEPIAYYYIKKAVWRSANCVEFMLVMDVLNTYSDGSDYVFKANTRIIREHKDRFIFTKTITATIDYYIQASSGTISETDEVELINDRGETVFKAIVTSIDSSQCALNIENPTNEQAYIDMIEPYLGLRFDLQLVSNPATFIAFTPTTLQDFVFNTTRRYYRKIDPVNENINPFLHCGDASGRKLENPKPLLAQNWYLLYRNQNDPSESLVNPVNCYLIPQNATPVNSAYISGGRLVPSFLEDGKYYYFAVADGQVTLSNGVTLSYGVTGRKVLLVVKTNNKISVTYFYCFQGYGETPVVDSYYDELEYLTFNSLPVSYRIENSFLNTGTHDYYGLQDNMPYSFDNSGADAYVDGVDKIDRTDAKNIKLIKLPYCPYNFGISGGKLMTDGSSDWDYAEVTQSGGGILYALKLKDMSTKLYASMTWYTGVYHPFANLHVTLAPDNRDLRNDIIDSKLFHSEFFKPTYYYDSFSFQINLEKCVITSYLDASEYNYLKLRYDMTSTINSRFMFTFNNYYINYGEQNYAKNLIIVRNNEEVLYNVAFINYVRTGYNFDQKAKALSNVANWTGVGLSMASIGASLLAPSVPLKVAGVVASLVSMATSIKSAVVSSVQNEQTLQNKILQTQNQTASVAGSDDVDLMSVYAENRLKYIIYEPMPNMKNLLNDMFFYAGYNSGRMGIPNHNTRCNFDYLECDAVLESAGANIPQEIIDEIKNCYKVGVTFIHKTTRTDDKWDIEQKYENWENAILEG